MSVTRVPLSYANVLAKNITNVTNKVNPSVKTLASNVPDVSNISVEKEEILNQNNRI